MNYFRGVLDAILEFINDFFYFLLAGAGAGLIGHVFHSFLLFLGVMLTVTAILGRNNEQ